MIRTGLAGFPLDHSFSPRIHSAAFKQCGLQGEYALFPISPNDKDALVRLLGDFRASRLTGLNVTIPYKQTVIPLLDGLSRSAEMIGAVNTIFRDNGHLIGENTDAPGFQTDLFETLGKYLRKIQGDQKVIVLGAGGAARAVVYVLLYDGWRVVIAARRIEQSRALIEHFSRFKSQLEAVCLSEEGISSMPRSIDLIVNTTPVGMFPDFSDSPWPSELQIPESAVVYDLVYNPKETQLIRDAKAAGAEAVSGIGMLIEQAALAFERWTGCLVDRNALRSLLEEL